VKIRLDEGATHDDVASDVQEAGCRVLHDAGLGLSPAAPLSAIDGEGRSSVFASTPRTIEPRGSS
jgi:hypothetical protein